MQTTRQLGKNAHIAKIINRLLKYLSTQNGANVVYFYPSDSVNIKIEEPYGSAVGCWLVGSGPGRGYKTLHFPIPIVALQLLWSVM